MKKTPQYIFLLFLFIEMSCNFVNNENKVDVNTTKSKNKEKENICFDYTAKHKTTYQELIEINASIFNENTDTVYFLSTSCEGDQYLLHFDKTKFEQISTLSCYRSYPLKLKIAPNSHYDFKSIFNYNKNEKTIKLGFDFISVEKSFDIDNVSLAEIEHRNENEQTIIWGNEKEITK